MHLGDLGDHSPCKIDVQPRSGGAMDATWATWSLIAQLLKWKNFSSSGDVMCELWFTEWETLGSELIGPT